MFFTKKLAIVAALVVGTGFIGGQAKAVCNQAPATQIAKNLANLSSYLFESVIDQIALPDPTVSQQDLYKINYNKIVQMENYLNRNSCVGTSPLPKGTCAYPNLSTQGNYLLGYLFGGLNPDGTQGPRSLFGQVVDISVAANPGAAEALFWQTLDSARRQIQACKAPR